MIIPEYLSEPPKGFVRRQSDQDRILAQIERGEVRVGPDAAREIARRIEMRGGFWGPPRYEEIS